MRATINQPIINDNVYDETGVGNGGSQIVEPEVLIPIIPTTYTPPITNIQNLEEVETQQPQSGSSQSGSSQSSSSQSGSSQSSSNQGSSSQSNTGSSSDSNPNVVPSATTGETKTYVDGGTTPDSNITVKKPKPNYLTFGIIGVIGLLVVYKLFLNKKSE